MPPLALGRMILISAVLAVAFVAALAVAPAQSYFTEWRRVQEQYNAAARASGKSAMEVQIQQIWNPTLGVVDRCTSCHVGMGGIEPIPGAPLFAAHPPIPHDPAEIGCTLCHAGQGRATTERDAHGKVHHWFDPILPRGEEEAGCGSCHSALPVGAPDIAAEGKRLFERFDCLACHRVEGRGGAKVTAIGAPDLSGIGLAGFSPGWHEHHLGRHRAESSGPFLENYGPLDAREADAIEAYLRTLVAAPRISEGKRLFHTRGCRGCHKIGGVGGEDGPELTQVGRKGIETMLFPAGFEGPETVRDWHVAHLLSPASVVPGSTMPNLHLARSEAESLALYLLSLRRSEVAAAYWPPDRLRVEKLGEREFGTDGRTLFQVFCSACHGTSGEGHRYGELAQAFPAVANPDFLAVAPDDFIIQTLRKGRPGRRMPAWGAMESGLRPAEVEAIVRWLRSREPVPPPFEEVARAVPDANLGRETYARECAVCHGANGEGAIGPSHNTAVFAALADDRLLYRTIVDGRSGCAMPRFRDLDARTLASLLGFIRSLSAGDAPKPDLTRLDGLPAGDPVRGAAAYAGACFVCHGEAGMGGAAPAIGGRTFLDAASDRFLAGNYLMGRCRDQKGVAPSGGAPAPHSEDTSAPRAGGDAAAVADAIAWLRSEAARPVARRNLWQAGGDVTRGSSLYARTCAGCHGARGEGKEGPSLNLPEFQSAAADAYLAATIIRGRRGTAMPKFSLDQPDFPRLGAQEVRDLVTFLRSPGGTGHK
ncbi:MAG: c-type cytochrome [Planctomycetes bacterium]|nr:c-type cytochrome [Planctomycetota bacterium]